ncbi:MAG: hypothetical protein HPY53_03430 [Brevinematales bacterium]|nr:hypothetical protein [Brevinematales bacterium]
MDIRLKWVGGATWVMDIGNFKIACDPVLCAKGTVHDYRFFKSERLENPVYTRDDFRGVDFWLITHLHEDHLDMRGLAMTGDAPVISPAQIGKKLTTVLKRGDTHRMDIPGKGSVVITAIPAIHSIRPLLGGMVGNGNGYLLGYGDGNESCSIYVSGDTLIHRRVVRALVGKPLDLAILNTGNAVLGGGLLSGIAGRITMNMKDVAKFDRLFHPKTIVPVHWGTFSHYRERVDSAGDLPASVKIIHPGETLTLG